MPVELYETLFILDSTKLAADPDGVKGQLHTTLEKHGSEILVTRPWDDRKLAYPIKKQKKGAYHVIYYRGESRKQADVEKDLRLNESILRHLTSHIDPKWADTIMDVARNDTSPAFAHRGMQEETAPTDVTPNLGEGLEGGEAAAAAAAGRRGPRREMAEKPE